MPMTKPIKERLSYCGGSIRAAMFEFMLDVAEDAIEKLIPPVTEVAKMTEEEKEKVVANALLYIGNAIINYAAKTGG